ncbi:WG repeat-containing protein [Maribacter ulvicola]|uniref:WG containing repeat-containing protein n=1 Tax=Maribacter ulvicola TaxID=228959 RepID=A0A1N6ZF62_9FLAO|nr:WG repeat-containing protein [Maribacter ulvicola]SIR25414.1 WG containing repeat-containing protein [Maribacter ulvicola]
MNKLILCIIYILLYSGSIYSQDHRNVYVFERNGKKGLVNNEMKIVAEATYERLGGHVISYYSKVFQDNLYDIWRLGDNYSVGSFIIFKYEGKYGVMNLDGQWIIDPTYNELKYTAVSGIFRFKEEDKFGLVNQKAEEFLKPNYDAISPEDKENIIVKEDDLYYIIDYKGNTISNKFSHRIFSYDYKTKIFIFEHNNKYGYKTIEGKTVFDAIFYTASSFHNGIAKVRKSANHTFEFVRDTGEIITPPTFNSIYTRKDFNGYFIENENYKHGLLDKNFNILLKPEYDKIGAFNNGFAYIKKDGKYGFINEAGKIIIPLMYANVNDFSEGVAPVNFNGKWGFINHKNEIKIDFKFEVPNLEPFYDGMAAYGTKFGECGYINRNGEVQIGLSFRKGSKFINGVAIVYIIKDKYLIDKEFNKFLLKSKNENPRIKVTEVEN